jgi:hypothetical protein
MKWLSTVAFLVVAIAASAGQEAPVADPGPAINGMYSFVHEGEFVQLEFVNGRLEGVVSRFKSDDPEKADAEFVDQYFESGKLEGTKLSFRTKERAGVWFEFEGVVERGSGKAPSDEAYWIIRGKLTEHRNNDGKVSEKTHELTMKSFPQDAAPEPTAQRHQ